MALAGDRLRNVTISIEDKIGLVGSEERFT